MAADLSNEPFPTPAQLVDRVPLIKNPGFWIPKPVELPFDIHPLPDDVQAYFVYPHTLESHVLQSLPPALSQLQAAHQERLALLASYAESKERARKAELNRLAPGWQEGKGVMQPLKKGTNAAAAGGGVGAAQAGQEQDLLLDGAGEEGASHAREGEESGAAGPNAAQAPAATPDLFKDFVDGLERLDSTLGSGSAGRNRHVDDLI
ncbi:hypothetical protein JCM10908_003521 [Rhodotorula pacifica]|uniref:uncharacterized protein n=1 Tax=Rhodotorula pacifica TaxID=1495444 RepID=UPI0031722BF6